MQIEELLTALITALNANTAALTQDVVDVSSSGMETATAQKQLSTVAPAPPEEESKSPTPTETAPASPDEVITSEKINEILKREFTRIGSVRAPIDKVMKDNFEATSLHNLKPEDYSQLVKLISEIPSA